LKSQQQKRPITWWYETPPHISFDPPASPFSTAAALAGLCSFLLFS
jgi:hypothetical protein